MVHTPPSPKRVARANSGSLADQFVPTLRQLFQRSASQPSHDAHHADFHHAVASPAHHHTQAADRQAFGSCTQVLATAVTALFRAINTFAVYEEALSPPAGASTTRRAKLLYVQLLDAAQRERGEWQGFAADASERDALAHDAADAADGNSKSAMAVLATSVADLTPSDTFALLNELVDVCFRSIRGPLVDAEVYAKHKKQIQAPSLEIPASLRALLEVRAILNDLARDEKLCLFRLLALWHAMATVSDAHDLARTIQDKHHLVFSDCSELDFLTTRRDSRHDPLAVALLHVLVLYHGVLFSDVEFLLVKQELQLSASVLSRRQEEQPAAAAPHLSNEVASTTPRATRSDASLAPPSHAASPVPGSPPPECTSSEGVSMEPSSYAAAADRAVASSVEMCEQVHAPPTRLSSTITAQHAHGPVVSLRPHAVLPRKSRQSKRASLEPLAVGSGKEVGLLQHQQYQVQQRQLQQARRQRQHSKTNGARPASSPLRAGALHRTVKRDASGGGTPSLEEHSEQPGGSAPPSAPTPSTANSAASETPTTVSSASLPPPTVRDSTVSPQPPLTLTLLKSAEVTASRLSKPAARHEGTDLANTYFSFSFAAATVRTMAVMAFYALRKRHYQNQQQEEQEQQQEEE